MFHSTRGDFVVYDYFNIKIGGEKDRARVTQLVISIVFQAKLKTPLFPPRQPCNQFVSSPRGSPRVRTPANCPRTLFHAQNHACTHACRPRSSAILGTNAPGSSIGWSVRRISRSEMSSPRSSWTIDHFRLHHRQCDANRSPWNDTRVSTIDLWIISIVATDFFFSSQLIHN